MESGQCSYRMVGPVYKAIPWYSLVGPEGEACIIIAIQVGSCSDRWVKVLDLELQD